MFVSDCELMRSQIANHKTTRIVVLLPVDAPAEPAPVDDPVSAGVQRINFVIKFLNENSSQRVEGVPARGMYVSRNSVFIQIHIISELDLKF